MSAITDKTKATFDLKTWVAIIVFVVAQTGSAVGLYYKMDNRITTVEKQSTETEETLKKNNLELINYKLDKIIKALEEK